jgi:chromosome segregation ATPase
MTPNPVERVAAKTFDRIVKAEAPTGELEVKPAQPIETDTPDQIIARLRKELEDERERVVALRGEVDEWHKDAVAAADSRMIAENVAERLRKANVELAAELNRQKLRAEKAEAEAKRNSAPQLTHERIALRTELSLKDKRIAALTSEVQDAQALAKAARELAQRAEARTGGLEASALAMQRARDKALADLEEERKDRLQAVKKSIDLEGRAKAAEKRVQELEAKAKPAGPAAPPAPARKGA